MISFSEKVKTEIIQQEVDYPTHYAIILGAIIKILGNLSIENNNYIIKLQFNLFILAKFVAYILSEEYNIKVNSKLRLSKFRGEEAFSFVIKNKVEKLLKDLNIFNHNGLILASPKVKYTNSQTTLIAFLKGCFLACGSISEPSKSYHLEFVVNDYEFAEYISQLLKKYDYNSNIIKRRNKQVVYLKRVEDISSFLLLIQVNDCGLLFENVRIEKELSNADNRAINCYQANLKKQQDAYQKVSKTINFIIRNNLMNKFSNLEQTLIKIRIENSEFSLANIAEVYKTETGETINRTKISVFFKELMRKYPM
ncbi:MAG: DNA-binding protein WhiA [Bacillales bacterium]|jgi:DNA-binding protein WhiA|nr:DNA-binding protein WhiA [Bacillales bacterium]